MEKQNTDLNAILESARVQLEIFRKNSQENPKNANIDTSSKPDDVTNISGSIHNSGNKPTENNIAMNCDDAPKILPAEIDDATCMVEEESSNKNFDSSTISLSDQQSIHNQSELMSQTTYTNIHQPSAPQNDDFILVSGPLAVIPIPVEEPLPLTSITEVDTVKEIKRLAIELVKENELIKENEKDGNNTTEQIKPVNDDEKTTRTGQPNANGLTTKLEDVTQNQMAGIFLYFGSGKVSENEKLEETELSNKYIQPTGSLNEDELKSVYGIAAGVPIETIKTKITNANVHEITEKLSDLKTGEDNESYLIKNNIQEVGLTNLSYENDMTEGNKHGGNVNATKKLSIFDNPLVPENFSPCDVNDVKDLCFIQPFAPNLHPNHFGQRFVARDRSNETNNNGTAINTNVLGDESSIVSNNSQSITVIFDNQSQDLEDDKSSKPFGTDECGSVVNSEGYSEDLHSELEAKPSLTDVHVTGKPPKRKNREVNFKTDLPVMVFSELDNIPRGSDNFPPEEEITKSSDINVESSVISDDCKNNSLQNGAQENMICINDIETSNKLTAQRYHHGSEYPRWTDEILEIIKILMPSEVIIHGQHFDQSNKDESLEKSESSSRSRVESPSKISEGKVRLIKSNIRESNDLIVPYFESTRIDPMIYYVPSCRFNVISIISKCTGCTQDHPVPDIVNVYPFANSVSQCPPFTSHGQTQIPNGPLNEITNVSFNKSDNLNNTIDNQLFSLCSSFLNKPQLNDSLNNCEPPPETLNSVHNFNTKASQNHEEVSSSANGLFEKSIRPELIVNSHTMEKATDDCQQASPNIDKRMATHYFPEVLIPETPDTSSTRTSSTNEVFEPFVRSPPRPPPRVRNHISRKSKFNFIKKLFGIKSNKNMN